MIQEIQLRVLPQVAADSAALRRYASEEQGIAVSSLKGVRILKRSVDARQRTIFVNLKVRLYINEQPSDDAYVRTEYPDVSGRPQVIVVGAGPGGLFAALRLIELGFRPIVLERGKNVHERKKDLANIARTQQVDEESNYCFGGVGQEPTPTESCIPVQRSAATLTRYSMCFASTVLLRLSLPMPTPI